MDRRYFAVLILVFFTNDVLAQNQTKTWFFSNELGLDFSTNPPSVLRGKIANNELNDGEAAAIICDQFGNTIFYTDGVSVWNRYHGIMPNGTGLLGSGTTTQTLIVPKPLSENYYYIFTATPQGNDVYFPTNKGLHYSVIDITLNNGLGDIVEKNIRLTGSTTEKISATLHANGTDIWVMMHEWGNNIFNCYLVTQNGIERFVVSTTGKAHNASRNISGIIYDNDAVGQMKFSPDGTKLALALFESQLAEIFDFDPSEGTLSNPVTIQGFMMSNPYGVEFSPNSKLLYISTFPFIYQYDLEAFDIAGSEILLDEKINPFVNFAQLQLAPDGKIYVARFFDFYLGVINEPNGRGIECKFEPFGFSLDPGNERTYRSNLGLPNFISSYFDQKLEPPKPYFEMPDVFTPNGDNSNEIFIPKKYYNIEVMELVIFNRWGNEIFRTSDEVNGWDGGGHSTGVYYWNARFRGINKKSYNEKGFIQLVR